MGHPTFDSIDQGPHRTGGSVTYACRVADRSGLPTMLAGRGTPDLRSALVVGLPRTDIVLEAAAEPTLFTLDHDRDGERTVSLSTWAGRMSEMPAVGPDDVVHLAPVCDELPPWVIAPGQRPRFIGLTAQGLLRRWDPLPAPVRLQAPTPAVIAALDVDAVVVSEEEVPAARALLDHCRSAGAVVVVTRGARGASAWLREERFEQPAASGQVQVLAQATVGAGDTFAAGLFMALADGEGVAQALATATAKVGELLRHGVRD